MIEGEVTGLRAIERDDLPKLLQWRNKPSFRRFFRECRELSLEQQKNWYDKIVLGDPNTHMFAIDELATGEIIGACGLCYIDHRNENADLSIYVGKDDLYIDESFAPGAARALMKYGFEELNLHRLWAEVYSTDIRKQGLFQTLGFAIDGRHRETRWVENQWVDSLFFGKLVGEWNH